MQSELSRPFSHTCIDAGVDWITCTARGKDALRAFEAQGEGILREEMAAGVELQPAAIRDYTGYRVPGVITGKRRDDSIIILSGACAARHWHRIAPLASNVSRLDVQATVWTHGEQPALTRWYYQRVRRLPPMRGRPRSFSLIQTHPHGDTLYVGKRQSDYFGRVYDYAAAHAQGQPRTIWRYEVECKRLLAARHSRGLLGATDPRLASESLVHSWFMARGIQPTWTAGKSPQSEGVLLEETERDTLAWFESSLSKTVARAIRRHGLTAVLDALHLSGLVIPSSRKERNDYAYHATSVVHGEGDRRATRATDGNKVLVQGK